MPSTYRRTVNVPRNLQVLDWDLIREIAQLYEASSGSNRRIWFTAEDDRGSYREHSIDALRTEIERRPDPPREMTLSLFGDGRDEENELHFQVWWGERNGAALEGPDEAKVVYAAERVGAAVRRAVDRIPRPSEIATQSRVRAFFYDPWTIGIGTALAATAIIAAIIAVTH
jgi:hypothetical protein